MTLEELKQSILTTMAMVAHFENAGKKTNYIVYDSTGTACFITDNQRDYDQELYRQRNNFEFRSDYVLRTQHNGRSIIEMYPTTHHKEHY